MPTITEALNSFKLAAMSVKDQRRQVSSSGRSFLSSGSAAGYLFLYSVWYFISKLEITGWVSSAIYFGYMFVIALAFFLLTGCIGFWACFWFVRKIYGAIKVDERR